MSSLGKEKLPNLDALRGIAALSVFMFHRFTLFFDPGVHSDSTWWLAFEKVVTKGFQGVSFFFVLSGFLIVWLAIRKIDITGRFNSWHFFIRRVFRIWPVYFLVVAFLFGILPHWLDGAQPYSWWQFSAFLANFNEISAGEFSNFNMYTVLWSVSVEEQFYLFFALIMLIPAIRNTKTLTVVLATVVIVSLIFRFVNHTDSRINYYHTLSVMNDIALGGILAVLYQSRKTWCERIGKMPMPVAASFYFLGTSWVIVQHTLLPEALYPIDRIVTGLFWCFVILHQVTATSGLQFSRIPGLNYLGQISYGFYMVHVIVLWFVGSSLIGEGIGDIFQGLFFETAAGFFITWIVSVLIYRLLESPILRLRSRFPG